jgi:hypothetical protein
MPTPSYSIFSRTFVVPVMITPPANADQCLKVSCEPIIVPPGRWKIVWNLIVADLKLASPAKLDRKEGIQTLLKPGYYLTDSVWISETQWEAMLEHDCKILVDAISYEICFTYGTSNHLYRTTDRRLIRHDPTIVVSRDPVEPPTGGGG